MAVTVLSLSCKRKKLERAPAHEEHDPRKAPITAAMQAPEGATPCDSAYNAFVALEAASVSAGMAPPWEQLPPRATFNETCARLKPEAQHCLIPKSQVDHKRCDPVLAELATDPWGRAVQAMLKPPPGTAVAGSAQKP